jgi:hypothetical protein
MDALRVIVDRHASADAKIAIFRSLFRGRDDVYPRRFESRRTGKSGYAPACANEWVRGICEKPRIKCAECPNRRFLSLTDTVVRWHLSGRDDEGQPFVAGIYPMLLDETCFLLAVDFDKQQWFDDALAFLETCRAMDVPAALERSRSGRGGHVWLFFDDAIPAALARRLASYILTETMERRPSGSIPTTASSRARTRCRRVDSETSLHCRCRRRPATSVTRCSLTITSCLTRTSGRFCRPCGDWSGVGSSSSSLKESTAGGSWASAFLQGKMTTSRGRRRRPGGKLYRSKARCRNQLTWFLGMRSISRRQG